MRKIVSYIVIILTLMSCSDISEADRKIVRKKYIVDDIEENGIIYVKDDRYNLCFGAYKNDGGYNQAIIMFTVPCDSIPKNQLVILNLK